MKKQNTYSIAKLTIISLFLIWPAIIILFFISIKNNIATNTIPWLKYTKNSIIIISFSAIFILILGTTLAWLTSFYNIKYKKLAQYLLILPIAMPIYINAFIYRKLLEYTGPAQEILRKIFNWNRGDYWFPEISSVGGIIFIISISLYPYMYIFSKLYFNNIGDIILSARTAGLSSYKIIKRAAIPMSAPAILAGLSLSLMEIIAEFGATQELAIDTIITGIHRTWFMRHDIISSAKASGLILIAILIIFFTNNAINNKSVDYKKKYHFYNNSTNNNKSTKASIFCWSIIIISSIIPIATLTFWTFKNFTTNNALNYKLLSTIYNTLTIGCITSIISIILAIYITTKLQNNIMFKILTIGYCIPGITIALGILLGFLWFDKLNINIGSCFSLTGTKTGLIYAYLLKFFAIPMSIIYSNSKKLHLSFMWSARSIGYTKLQIIYNTYYPMLKKPILYSFALIFIDIIKELPLTLIIRPFNFNTLATKIYEMSADERYIEAATYSWIIALITIILIFIINTKNDKIFC